MNAKRIRKHLKKKLDDWVANIQDESIRAIIRDHAIVTGGALVSLLNGEEPNDYDIYFTTHSACRAVAQYYAGLWNGSKEQKKSYVEIQDDDKRVRCFIRSDGVASDNVDDDEMPFADEDEDNEQSPKEEKGKPKYRPRFFSANAISLSDKIQIVIRFCGPVQEIHTNYDFVHCTCSYDYKTDTVTLPSEALTAIINKELVYVGSKYPVASVVRARKFLSRGWHINAGQYVKMCLQICKLDLYNLDVFKDQLTGVDSAYFSTAIEAMERVADKNPDFRPDETYLFDIINKIF